MNIPRCLKLEQRQIDRLNKWLKTLDKKQLDAAFEEDCSCASSVTFKIFETGIGTVIIAEALRQKCDLSIGDDNEFVSEIPDALKGKISGWEKPL